MKVRDIISLLQCADPDSEVITYDKHGVDCWYVKPSKLQEGIAFYSYGSAYRFYPEATQEFDAFKSDVRKVKCVLLS